MKTLLTLFVLLLTCTSFGQRDSTSLSREFGVNLAPLIIPLYSGEFNLNRIELTYVKNRTTHFSRRTKVSFVRKEDGGVISPNPLYQYKSDTLTTDANITTMHRYYQKEAFSIRAFIGAEYVQKVGFSFLYGGLAFTPGLVKNRSFRYFSEFQTGTSYGYTAFAGDFSFLSLVVGVSPYIGLKVPLSQHFLLNFQTGVSFDYHLRNFRPYDSTDTYRIQRSELRLWPVMTELGLFYSLPNGTRKK